jgi:preprotein translocase subunit SecA
LSNFRKKNTPNPSLALGFYPEKPPAKPTLLANIWFIFLRFKHYLSFNRIAAYQLFVQAVSAKETPLKTLSNAALSAHIAALKADLSLHGLNDGLTVDVFAAVVQSCTRYLGITPYHTQIIAAKMMQDGQLAEMATGEGKTLTAGICVASAALAGIPVHVITANDYLVERDAETLAPLFTALGLSVGVVTKQVEFVQRQLAYAQNITYCTAKELVFDYLRDQTQLQQFRSEQHLRAAQLAGRPPQLLLRGLYMAIIDEADSILIDEARVPLILSNSNQDVDKIDFYRQALTLANSLVLGRDFNLIQNGMAASLTESGLQSLQQSTRNLGALWKNKIFWSETICQALAALYCFTRDKHYIVAPNENAENAVHIVDEITGRVSVGRVWSKGLHQLIELKEDCQLSGDMVTMTQITYQRFFPKYLQLGGMSGTLNGLDAELYSTYGLTTSKVPLRQKSQRTHLPTRLFATVSAQFKAAVAQVKQIHLLGRPILIGTDSVADSEQLSALLTLAGLKHSVLNAKQNIAEANIVALAGQVGNITLSTNMAGRGTDIALSDAVKKLGGLHVISCQHNSAKRIDRQLIGRAARQGDPGSAQMFIALERLVIYRKFAPFLIRFIPARGLAFPCWLVNGIVHLPQSLEAYNQRAQRQTLLKQDQDFAKNSQLHE